MVLKARLPGRAPSEAVHHVSALPQATIGSGLVAIEDDAAWRYRKHDLPGMATTDVSGHTDIGGLALLSSGEWSWLPQGGTPAKVSGCCAMVRDTATTEIRVGGKLLCILVPAVYSQSSQQHTWTSYPRNQAPTTSHRSQSGPASGVGRYTLGIRNSDQLHHQRELTQVTQTGSRRIPGSTHHVANRRKRRTL